MIRRLAVLILLTIAVIIAAALGDAFMVVARPVAAWFWWMVP
jgi:hypothetical protein